MIDVLQTVKTLKSIRIMLTDVEYELSENQELFKECIGIDVDVFSLMQKVENLDQEAKQT